MMKALVKKKNAPGLWLEEVPVPKPGDTDILIKVRKASICGTDIHIHKWDAWAAKTIKTPMVIGHEFAGEVVEVGSRVKHLKVGDRVSGEGHITCGHCRNCLTGKRHLCPSTIGVGLHRHGCFAEYFTLPAENAFLIPASISDELASIFDPCGNAVHTALSFDLVGEDILITGAGPIGLMAAAIAKHAGARHIVITDLNEYRLNLAKQMGATCAVNVSKVSLKDVMPTLDMTEGFTVGLEMSGSPKGLSTLLEYAECGAHIALLGLLPQDTNIDWDQVIFKGITLKGIYGREIFATWYKLTHLLQAGLDVSPVLTHSFPYQEFEKGFEVMMSGQSGKVVLDWSGN